MRRCLLSCLAAALGALAAPAFAQGFADPVAYCKAVGTIDRPDARYAGPTSPGWIAAALKLPDGMPFAWRCAGGAVLACAYGANIPCDSKARTSRVPTGPIRDYCRQNPNSDGVPMVVTGHDTVIAWRCDGTHPAVAGADKVDAQGYAAAYWTKVAP